MAEENNTTKVSVVGAGGWGTALAIAANRVGSQAKIWARSESMCETIRETRTNAQYLPEVFIDPDIAVTNDLAEVRGADFVVLAVPAQNMRAICIALADVLAPETPLVLASKGIERGSLSLMHEVVEATLPQNPILILSGPNFATEVARGLPTATTVACRNDEIANQFIYAIGGKFFRPYYTDDIISTQVGGAVKNVIAIACGVAIGMGYGENARAALMTRGLAEMMRLSEALGGRRENLMGLSGMGDLVLTCASTQSRNFSYGVRLGNNRKEMAGLQAKESLAEGMVTAESVALLSEQLSVPMPLCNAISRIIHKGADIDETIEELLSRPFVMDVEQSSIRKSSISS
ncbi:MAG: NAD(P)-dependent glycerol-3-phosphate dehydrogenase [Rickettsiales bacterium]|nr:NAD(P)-dependent glycerol-3-phosphate dehydrogenase [Rickettsiales bacterium]